ncbi:MAG: type II secretion system F family protein [Patescibacteria group bacterium]
MRFKYKAQTAEGTIISGEAEAPDRFALVRQMKDRRERVIVAEEMRGSKLLFIEYIEKLLGHIGYSDKIVFMKNLGSMIEAGLVLSRALDVLGRQMKNKRFREIVGALREDIAKGIPLSDAFAKYPDVFSGLAVSMTRAGEESGSLPGSLKIVGEHLERSYALIRKIRGALIYPVIIIAVMITIGILMLIYVVPILSGTFRELGLELPLMTRIIIGISNFLINDALLFLAIAVAIIALIAWFLRSRAGKHFLSAVFLKIPIIKGIVREVNAARTARTLSSLLSAGVPLVAAIDTTRDVVQNTLFKKVMETARGSVQRGDSLSSVFAAHEDLYPVLVGEMVAVGEETGKLSEMLGKLALFYEDSVAEETKDLSVIIEPFLMVIIGAGVGFFAVSMITPLYSVLGNV